MFVDEIMIKDVIKIESDKTVWDACDLYNNHKIGCLIVTKDGHLDGIVTERDIIHRIIINKKDPKNTKIEEIMSTNVISILPTVNIQEAALIMRENKIKKLPVISDDGNLVGIVTITDIVRILPNFIKMFDEETDNEIFK